MKGAVQGVQRSMEGQGNERLKPAQIDLRKMADTLLLKAWLIVLVAVLGGACGVFIHAFYDYAAVYRECDAVCTFDADAAGWQRFGQLQ